jgi:hypothetical protein
MRWFPIQRRLFAPLSMTVLAGGMALLSGSAASAALVSATPFNVQASARLQLAPTPAADPLAATLLPTGPINGTLDDAGGISIGPVTLSTATDPIDRVGNPLLAPPLDVVLLTAPNGFSGTIDAAAGNVKIVGADAFFTFSGNGFACTTAPVDLTMYGVSYDPASGAASFATDSSFVFPAFPLTDTTCPATYALFNDLLGLPTAPGAAALTVDVTLSLATDPTTTPPTAAPGGGGSGSGSGGSGAPAAHAPTPVAVGRNFVERRASPKTAAPKSKSTSAAKSAAAGKTTTPTTAYVWKGGSGDVSAGQFNDQASPPVAARPPILPQESTAKIASDDGNRYGLGILVLVLGAGVAAVLLLRSEARRFFRRRERAAF